MLGHRLRAEIAAAWVATEPPATEPVGAGDAFAAGFLYGRLRDMTAAEGLRPGYLIASSALTSATDHADLMAAPVQLETIVRSARTWPGRLAGEPGLRIKETR